MNITEYKDKKNALIVEHDRKVKELMKEYALSNSTVKVGDMVTDHMGTVRVERVLVTICSLSTGTPSCIYRGIEYTKAGKPNKKGNKRNVYQTNLKETK